MKKDRKFGELLREIDILTEDVEKASARLFTEMRDVLYIVLLLEKTDPEKANATRALLRVSLSELYDDDDKNIYWIFYNFLQREDIPDLDSEAG